MNFPKHYLYDESNCQGIFNFRLKEAVPPNAMTGCPFCGQRKAELANTWTPYYWIECGKCGTEIGDDKSNRPDTREGHMASALRAITLWNTRA